jgi:hypothetical protein
VAYPAATDYEIVMRWSLALFCLAFSCSTLPEYAAPKAGTMSGDDPMAGDLIRYRTLKRSDFKGTEAPEAFRAVADKVGAATCARIVSDPPAQIEITQQTSPDGDKTTTGRIKVIGYRALMDRSCSWWNDKADAQPDEYVLEHEQIHFAIFEVEARRLDRQVKEMAESTVVEGDTLEDVKAQIEARIQHMFDETTETLMERNTDFDEDTSLGYEPARQKQWLATVTAELAED